MPHHMDIRAEHWRAWRKGHMGIVASATKSGRELVVREIDMTTMQLTGREFNYGELPLTNWPHRPGDDAVFIVFRWVQGAAREAGLTSADEWPDDSKMRAFYGGE